jgi:SAM-dependent methyltransferase
MRMPPAVASSIRLQQSLSDAHFDQVYPREHRVRSWVHWTPLDVAYRVCALLDPTPTCRVLDVGSGVGKMCHVGAMTTEASWFGIERDHEMVRVAIEAAAALGVAERTTFVEGNADDLDWSIFDGFYLYNPYAEQLWAEAIDPEARRTAYTAAIASTQQRLAAAAPGTRVVTYHGFGGDMPSNYELVHREPAHEDELQLWIRRASSRRTPSIDPAG